MTRGGPHRPREVVGGTSDRGAIMEDATCPDQTDRTRSAPLPPTTVSSRSIATEGLSSTLVCGTAPCHALQSPSSNKPSALSQLDARRASLPNLRCAVLGATYAGRENVQSDERLSFHAQIHSEVGRRK